MWKGQHFIGRPWAALSLLCDCVGHRRIQEGQRGHAPPKFLENIDILCIERRFSKQNSVIRLKSNILASKFFAPPNFWAGYATGVGLSWLTKCLTWTFWLTGRDKALKTGTVPLYPKNFFVLRAFFIKTYNENKNIASLKMHFSHQTLKPGYAPAARWLQAGIPKQFSKISGFLNKAVCTFFRRSANLSSP